MSKTFTPMVLTDTDKAENPVWRVAHILSEWYNDSAPLGWERYVTPAEQIIEALKDE